MIIKPQRQPFRSMVMELNHRFTALAWPPLLHPALCLALACAAEAQEQPPRAPLGKSGAREMPLHRPIQVFTPADALRHLVRGNRAMLAATRTGPDKKQLPPPLRRPAGAGPYLSAVALSSGHRRSVAELFSARHRDLLVFESPGPSVRTAEIAALEQAVRRQRLSLLAVLVHPQDIALQPPPRNASRTERAHFDSIAAAHRLAAAARVPLADAHGLLQAERVWRTSPYLSAQRRAGRFRIAVGVISPTSGGIRWVTRWERELPLVQLRLGAVPNRPGPEARSRAAARPRPR